MCWSTCCSGWRLGCCLASFHTWGTARFLATRFSIGSAPVSFALAYLMGHVVQELARRLFRPDYRSIIDRVPAPVISAARVHLNGRGMATESLAETIAALDVADEATRGWDVRRATREFCRGMSLLLVGFHLVILTACIVNPATNLVILALLCAALALVLFRRFRRVAREDLCLLLAPFAVGTPTKNHNCWAHFDRLLDSAGSESTHPGVGRDAWP